MKNDGNQRSPSFIKSRTFLRRSRSGRDVRLVRRSYFEIQIEVVEAGVRPFGLTAILNRERPADDRIVQGRRNDFEMKLEKAQKGKAGLRNCEWGCWRAQLLNNCPNLKDAPGSGGRKGVLRLRARSPFVQSGDA